MKVCYIDEAGSLGKLPSKTSPIEPVFVITGLVIDHARIPDVTKDFLKLKHRFFPGSGPTRIDRWLNWMLVEIKGSEIRKEGAARSRRKYGPALTFLDHVLSLMEKHEIYFTSRVWVKGIGDSFDGKAV